jgi:hypothetical protein
MRTPAPGRRSRCTDKTIDRICSARRSPAGPHQKTRTRPCARDTRAAPGPAGDCGATSLPARCSLCPGRRPARVRRCRGRRDRGRPARRDRSPDRPASRPRWNEWRSPRRSRRGARTSAGASTAPSCRSTGAPTIRRRIAGARRSARARESTTPHRSTARLPAIHPHAYAPRPPRRSPVSRRTRPRQSRCSDAADTQRNRTCDRTSRPIAEASALRAARGQGRNTPPEPSGRAAIRACSAARRSDSTKQLSLRSHREA